ncbi:MAG: HesA/MoeB/ThiF family protein [Anaerovorax sp.]
MEKRYERNMNTLTPDENEKLRDFKVCVIGCGGLGGYVIELLGRLGIGNLTAVDGDVFDETNLNRQILSKEDGIGTGKAEAAKIRMKEVNSQVNCVPIHGFLTAENSIQIIAGHDVVVDALDNMETRRILESACEKEKIPMIHGAIAGWYGQVAVIFPGDRIMEKIYPIGANKGEETELGNPSFTPALVASLEVAETVKVLLKKGSILRNQLLMVDILEHNYEIFEL